MRNLLAALVAVAALSACESTDPTQREDMSCTAKFEDITGVCSQVRITRVEAVDAEFRCTRQLGGTWSTDPCSAEHRMPGGYCKIEASKTNWSGSDVKVFFYDSVALVAAQAACALAEGDWIDG